MDFYAERERLAAPRRHVGRACPPPRHVHRRGGLPDRGVAPAASGGNAAAVACEPAASVVPLPREEEERARAAYVGSKRCLPLTSAHPPPKRRPVSATRRFPPGCGRLPAASPAHPPTTRRPVSTTRQFPPGCGRHAAARPLAVSPSAAAGTGTSALNKESAAGPHVSAALDIGPPGVPAVLVDGRGNTAGSSELGRKELVQAAPLQPEPMMSSAERSFPTGCGKEALLSLLVGGGIGEVQLPLGSGVADCGLGMAEVVVSEDGCISAVHGHGIEIVPPQHNDTTDGTVHDDELEGVEITPEAVVQGSQVSASDTMHDSAASTHGASVQEFSAVDTSVMQLSNEKIECEEKRSSQLVAIDVEVLNKSIGSSSNIVAESLVEDSSKQDMMGKILIESARMNRASSDVAACVSGDGTKISGKAMFTHQKLAKPIKVIQKSALDTHYRLPEDKKTETEHGRHVIISRVKDTYELTTDRVMQAPMTQEKEAAPTRGFFGPRKKVKVKVPAHLGMKIASTGSKGKLNAEVASNLDDDDILKALVVHEGMLELYLNNSSGLPSARCQSQNADDRSKFKTLCRRFEFVCRALVQAVEQHSLKIRRIDLEADRVIRKLPGFTKHGPIVGHVPGVEVGDEFLYRVQLAIVGLHRVYQGGIDTTTYRNGERIAISIVASGGYPDELPCSGELIYTGSGGKPARKKDGEDQKLERGNLALKNCIKTKTPVRVIHGFKSQNTEGGSHSRAKQISTFTYDGLYQVVDLWMNGRPGSRVFKYKLQKIPGQPELPMHIAKGMRKSKTRPGLCIVDLSQGKEGSPVCVINTVDDVRPKLFPYITRIKYPFGLTKIRHQGCDCTNGCSDSASCACALKNGGEIPFNSNGAIVNGKPLIFECGPSCKCPPSCQNRVSQHGMKIPLEVFRTTRTGWGVRSLRSISSGSFICEYVGELLYGKEADKRRNSDYLFDIGLNSGDESLCNGLLSAVPGYSSSSCPQTMEDVGFTIDAAEYGNIGRFINHSCSPNLYAQNVLWDHHDQRMPHIMFFAAETVPPLQELTYDYNYETDHVQNENGRVKFKVCQCGSPQCSGRLY